MEKTFIDNGDNWLATTAYTGHGFTIKLGDCKTNLAGIQIKNTVNGKYRNRAARMFRVSGIEKDSERWHWVELLQAEFEDPLSDGAPSPELETFYFSEVVQLQLLKYDLDSFWGNLGGGLDYFAVITVSGKHRFNVLSAINYQCVTQICAKQVKPRSALHTTADPLLLL